MFRKNLFNQHSMDLSILIRIVIALGVIFNGNYANANEDDPFLYALNACSVFEKSMTRTLESCEVHSLSKAIDLKLSITLDGNEGIEICRLVASVTSKTKQLTENNWRLRIYNSNNPKHPIASCRIMKYKN